MQRLICYDPGVTTGCAVFVDGQLTDCYTIEHDKRFSYLEYQFPQISLPGTVVVIENYIGRVLTKEASDVLRLIGMLEYATRLHLGVSPVYQRAQTRISFLPQAKKLVSELPVQRKWLQHHYDSTAHGLAFLYYTRNTDPAALAPDLCLTQGETDDIPTAREA